MIYLVTSEEYSLKPTIEIVKEAVKWVDIVQMREKNKDREELVELGSEIIKLCRENNTKFIINDDPYLAKELDADGVHIGQEDMKKFSIEKIREIIGRKMIGISAHSLKQVKDANNMDIDYIAYGPIFPTQTKDYFLGTDDIKEILKIASKQLFFIGGIKSSNVNQLYELGAENIAAITAITKAEDIPKAIKELGGRD